MYHIEVQRISLADGTQDGDGSIQLQAEYVVNGKYSKTSIHYVVNNMFLYYAERRDIISLVIIGDYDKQDSHPCRYHEIPPPHI